MVDKKDAEKGFEDWKKRELEVGNIISTQKGDFIISYSEDSFIHHRYYSLVKVLGTTPATNSEIGREFGSVESIDDLYWLFVEKFNCIPHFAKFDDAVEYAWEF